MIEDVIELHTGDCRDVMGAMDADSVDTIITDPPYGLEFMGKDWDHGVPGFRFWQAALRVAKPGAHLLAFGGTRTHHRLMVAIEDAGWEIRDTVMWVYGSGFPKSHNFGRQLDGWSGYGTALKPAWEPIIVAMKPLDGTYADNALTWGVAGMWVDGGRVGTEQTVTRRNGDSGGNGAYGRDERVFERTNPPGRWPANLIHDGSPEVLAGFPVTTSGSGSKPTRPANPIKLQASEYVTHNGFGDSGSAARFFYCAKASRSERNAGLEGMEEKVANPNYGNGGFSRPTGQPERQPTPTANHHPTVKPLALMRYLCRLTKTPTGGVVFDPFMGSGSTGCAAVLEGRSFIGIDQDADYVEIARRRIAYWQGQYTPADNSDLPMWDNVGDE